MIKKIIVAVLLTLGLTAAWAQVSYPQGFSADYNNPSTYEIGGITVSGSRYLDPNAIIAITGLSIGDKIKIPGDELTLAIRKLWAQGILGDIQVRVTAIKGKYIFLDFFLVEKPRLSKINFIGAKKSEQDDLEERISLVKGTVMTDARIKNIQINVSKYYRELGYFNTEINIQQEKDTMLSNNIILNVTIKKNEKVKINQINFIGATEYEQKVLRKKFKKTKMKSFKRISRSKFVQDEYDADKEKLTIFYQSNGYRDFSILSDSIYNVSSKLINIDVKVHEGHKFYIRNIVWSGNYLYRSTYLDTVLGIKKGDIYDRSLLESRLNFNPTGIDISSLYLDDGYLFFQVEPVETQASSDSVDLEIRVYEGTQATINRITVYGNTKTNDHVVLRELRTYPGEKFSRAALIRSQREIAQLGFFNPESIGIQPIPDPVTGTVDIEYTVEEKPSDQIQLSGGYGQIFGFVGTLGLAFNNFSIRNIDNFKSWDPLPSGDGQRFSVSAQSNGPYFQTYSTSFTEPWLGGKRPNSLTISVAKSIQRSGAFNVFNRYNRFNTNVNVAQGRIIINNITVNLGRRLRWPDDFFMINHTLSFTNYRLQNYSGFLISGTNAVSNGDFFNVALTNTISRNSVDNPTYPRKGSSLTFSVALTPPYSLMQKNRDVANESFEERFKLVEYHKWMFDGSWFTKIVGKMVLNTRVHFGYLGSYNSGLGVSPFERFKLGGAGIFGFNFFFGYDLIGLRGYYDDFIGRAAGNTTGGVVYNKYVFELRYPLSLNPMASVFLVSFAEAGNNWQQYDKVNPFEVYRTVGMGARIFMPAFGMIGVDYGFGLDEVPGCADCNKNRFTFTIGQQIR